MSLESAPRRIAIVEDDPAVLNSLDFMFTAAGYRVFAYDCAHDAAAAPEIATVDCLVVDYALPDGDGLALLKRLRQIGVASPAILIASTPNARCRQRAREDGIPLMEKPLLGDNLGGWVERLITNSRVENDQ